ncbi:MAG: DNA translocase FtsK 4TM domain-containing protein [Alphaproteobacteria bacterium]|nr:DNA translocase FtsK 4TM domain-containing protein [Rickettsiales bacterium]
MQKINYKNSYKKKVSRKRTKTNESQLSWFAIFILLCATFLCLSLLSYSPLDNCVNVVSNELTTNWCGRYGAIISDILLQSFGFGSWILVFILYSWSITFLANGEIQLAGKTFWMVISVVSFSVVAGFFRSYNFTMQMLPGGYVGYNLFGIISSKLGIIMAFCVSVFTFTFSLFIAVKSDKTLFSIVKNISRKKGKKEHILNNKVVKIIVYILTLGPISSMLSLLRRWGAIKAFLKGFLENAKPKDQKLNSSAKQEVENKIVHDIEKVNYQYVEEPTTNNNSSYNKTEGFKRSNINTFAGASIVNEEDDYIPPSISLLMSIKQDSEIISASTYEVKKQRLLKALNDFSIRGKISKYHVGPVVTLYELELEAGTKASRVIGLASDIARSMQVSVIRIADMPSRGIMGIEIPNKNPKSVSLKEILTSPEHHNTKHCIPIVLGQDIMGCSIVDDLAKMPHLLVAGTTGSGKSVGLNAMIVSMLYKLSPAQCRFIMIDPKMLELSLYNGVPHLLTQVITDPAQAILAMRWVVQEMQKRNKKMSNLSVRNISSYNQKIATAKMRGAKIIYKVEIGYDPVTRKPIVEQTEEDPETIPYIVVIIDEMADLMMVAGKEMEGLIQRITQMARAAGIHLIMATQRPSVDVITGVIKANMSTRISYKVTSRIDSGIIIGEPGAEQLLGNGDMLYLEAGRKPKRIHGPFLSEQEVESVVKDLSSRYETSYVDILSEVEFAGNNGAAFNNFGAVGGNNNLSGGYQSNDDASVYKHAVEIVLTDKKTSISYLQRKMRIGYNKAANFIEKMEEDGILSQADRTGKRNIINQS